MLVILRTVSAVVSLAILAAAVYLLWSWQRGDLARDAAGELVRVREDWRLWSGLFLLGWSFLGRLVVLPLIAGRDERQSRVLRGEGRQVPGRAGGELYTEATGPHDAPPILFTHGWGLDSTIWDYARQDLSNRFRVLSWDLPGLGRSRAGEAPVDLSRFAAELEGLIAAAGKPVVLVGHSIGGMIIQTLAHERAEALRGVLGVVLLNTTCTNPMKTTVLDRFGEALQPLLEPILRLAIWVKPLAWLSAWQSYLSGSAHLMHRLGFGRTCTRSQLEHVTRLITRNDPAVSAKGDLAMFRWDAGQGPERLTVPTLVVAGEADIVTKPGAGRQIAARLLDGRLLLVEGANHMGPLERAELYNSAIADFAAQVQRPRTAPSAGSPAAEPARRRAHGGANAPPPAA